MSKQNENSAEVQHDAKSWSSFTLCQLCKLKLLLTAVHWHSVKLLVICSGGYKTYTK